MLRLQR